VRENSFFRLSFVLIGILIGVALSACGDDEESDIDPTPTIAPTVEPTATPEPVNPECTKVMGKDGPGGFLWKPKSDNTGTLVVLFPSQFAKKFETVEAPIKKGGKEKLYFTSFGNGDRQHWRGRLAGGKYTGKIVANPGNCIWKVDTPAQRVD
jgi:hypothetical protein